ncbi:uncharacterized protein Ecym_7444 [Eremothecium cymbalariae DBVPG|uniref:Uncharacterized protein n=1 Tax=Eremothecium cymbalariae (strain CBS 270.75 / DBVPG 7215 / KCTC 17166 / NRRL Y-17582) TaxID=931890 RepID=G8JWP9_ERECY|nr:hypothetical protein Ecym_7444 [Eremothecium cymbalariae DBVPG\
MDLFSRHFGCQRCRCESITKARVTCMLPDAVTRPATRLPAQPSSTKARCSPSFQYGSGMLHASLEPVEAPRSLPRSRNRRPDRWTKHNSTGCGVALEDGLKWPTSTNKNTCDALGIAALPPTADGVADSLLVLAHRQAARRGCPAERCGGAAEDG